MKISAIMIEESQTIDGGESEAERENGALAIASISKWRLFGPFLVTKMNK